MQLLLFDSSAEVRREALAVAGAFVARWEPPGRHAVYSYLPRACPHPEVVALTFQWIKSEIIAATKIFEMTAEKHWFTGRQLLALMAPFLAVPEATGRSGLEPVAFEQAHIVISFVLFCLLWGLKEDTARAVQRNELGVRTPPAAVHCL
jgi:hypothetical protein